MKWELVTKSQGHGGLGLDKLKIGNSGSGGSWQNGTLDGARWFVNEDGGSK